jgi:HK97 family phage prohead protease
LKDVVSKAYSATEFSVMHEKAGDQRKIKGIASTPKPDREGDVVLPMGAKFKVPFPLLSAHDHSKPIGEVTKATATPNGIEIEAQLAPEGVQGYIDDAWKLIKSGLMKGLSIGFRALTAPESKGGNRVFNQYEVYELSVCTVPMNAGASITFAKSNETNNQGNNMRNQVLKAISKDWTPTAIREVQKRLITKAEGPVPATTTGNTPGLYYAAQSSNILTPPQTLAILTQFAQNGALQLPPHTRILSQSALLSAGVVAEGAPYAAAAPDLEFALNDDAHKVGLIVGFNGELLAAGNFDGAVEAYVTGVLESAASNGVDQWFIATVAAAGLAVTAAGGDDHATATVVGESFVGDLRQAIWVGSPATLTLLRNAANPTLGPNGGFYLGVPAVASLAMPANTLHLIDRSRLAVYDGPQIIELSEQAAIVFDSAPGSAPANTSQPTALFQKNMVALKVTRYFDAKLLSQPLVVTLS